VIDVLAPFLAFVETYSPLKAHNMMAIRFDPCSKKQRVMLSVAALAMALSYL
jgi:hypothetical protein